MTNSVKARMVPSSDEPEIFDCPLEVVVSDRGPDPFFAVHYCDGAWLWEFHDEKGTVRAKQAAPKCDLREVIRDIRETQRRIGNLTTPILRVV